MAPRSSKPSRVSSVASKSNPPKSVIEKDFESEKEEKSNKKVSNSSEKKTAKKGSVAMSQKSNNGSESIGEKTREKKKMIIESDSDDTADNFSGVQKNLRSSKRVAAGKVKEVVVKVEESSDGGNDIEEEEKTIKKKVVKNTKQSNKSKDEDYQEDMEEEEEEEDDVDEDGKEENDSDFDEPKKAKKKIVRKSNNNNNNNKTKRNSQMEIEDVKIKGKLKRNSSKKINVEEDEDEGRNQTNQKHSDDELLLRNSELIDVQMEQGKKDLEDQYEMPYYLTKEFIKDDQGRPLSDPNYDGSTVFIPVQELKKETRVFQQYWRTKAKNYDKVVFFRFGRLFMCFFNDALLLKRLFDCQISMWGKRPFTSIFDNSFKIYVKELLEKSQKSCVVVDQIEHSEEKANDQDIIKREITQIITKGTYTDYIDNSEDYNARFLMCVVESETDHSYGIAMVDCTTHQIFMDDIKNDPAGNQIRTILSKMKPVEVYSVFNNLSDQTKNICRTTCKPQFTYDKKFEFQSLTKIFEEIKNEYREKIPIVKATQVNNQNDLIKKDKKIQKQRKSLIEGEEEESKEVVQYPSESGSCSSSEDEEIENFDLQREVQQHAPKFTYGELSQDYPVLLKEIEDMYLADKQKYEENFREQQLKNKRQNQMEQGQQEDNGDVEEEDEQQQPNFDIEFQYYMMLQAVMIMLSYLRELKLSENVFRMGSFQLLDSNIQKETYLHLDAHAIENLDIFEANVQGKKPQEGSLMNFIDYTSSEFGRRMLKRWLTYPLKNMNQIEQRQEAIEDLMEITTTMDDFDKRLKKFGDIERQISRVFNSTQKSRLKHSSFENFSHQRLKDAFLLVKDLKDITSTIKIFEEDKHNFKSTRLKKLTTVKDPADSSKMRDSTKSTQRSSYLGQKLLNKHQNKTQSNQIVGMFPDLQEFIQLVDNQLEEDDNGQCQPKEGADPQYDEVVFRIQKIYKEMKTETSSWRKKLGSEDVKLVKSKGQWEIQVPDKLVEGNKKPKDLNLTSRVKNYSRFQSEIIMNLCNKLKKEEHHLAKALAPFCEKFFFNFFKNRDLLYQAVNCVGELDCLCSLAKCAMKLPIKCKPTFVADPQAFELKEMYHPQLLKEGKRELVPNDTVFSQGTLCLLVTGPNMGGKSTLLRQTCLAVILAQIGAYIPAYSFKTAIRDRIFCRIGASDRLLEGKSTFLVEMEETRDIVKEATCDSIVLLDELGRGTSTFDGVSIAYGVLRYLVDEIKCLTLFSTHYHMLIDEFKLYKNIENYLMDYYYDEKERKIVFKYKFVKGFSDKSFGINVAKMAGLPLSVVAKAEEKEEEINDENRDIKNIRGLTKLFNILIQQCIHDTPELELGNELNKMQISQ